MKNKIYPKDWLSYHPYRQTDEVDLYYTRLANRLCECLGSAINDPSIEEIDRQFMAIHLAAWFEDVISQTGIWQAFTAKCKEMYGAYLPFYPIGEDYLPDEINVEDVRFLLWHNIQFLREEGKIVNPENPGIEKTALMVYGILSEEYETAPENERLQDFLWRSNIVEPTFEQYLKILEWFHYGCYFNIANMEQYFDESDSIIDERTDLSEEEQQVVINGVYKTLMLRGRRNLLSLTSPEWLGLVEKQHPGLKKWSEVRSRKESCYLLEEEDEVYLYLKDLVTDECLKVDKCSLMQRNSRGRQPGETTLICELVNYGSDVWYQFGLMLVHPIDNTNVVDYVADLKKSRSKENEKVDFLSFLEASGGKDFVFCRSNEEVKEFLVGKMGYTIPESLDLPNWSAGKKGLMVTANPEYGIQIIGKYVECIKSPDNPFYDQQKAEENAILFYVAPDVVSYPVACRLQDQGLLPDAQLKSLKTPEYAKEFLHKNGRFLTDYFFHRNREKDLEGSEYRN